MGDVEQIGSRLPVETSGVRDLSRELSVRDLALQKVGITDDVLFQTAREGLVACRYDKDGDETSTPDWNARFKFWEGLMRIKGYIKSGGGDDNSVNFNLTVQQREDIKKRLSVGFNRVLDVGSDEGDGE